MKHTIQTQISNNKTLGIRWEHNITHFLITTYIQQLFMVGRISDMIILNITILDPLETPFNYQLSFSLVKHVKFIQIVVPSLSQLINVLSFLNISAAVTTKYNVVSSYG